MKNNNRLMRTNDEIKKEVAEIIRSGLKDPRINAMTSVIKVNTTQDLKFSKIYVSVMGDEEQKKAVMEGLGNATGFIRRELAKSVNLRNTPQLSFVLDDSLEIGIRINKIINEINSASENKEADGGSDE